MGNIREEYKVAREGERVRLKSISTLFVFTLYSGIKIFNNIKRKILIYTLSDSVCGEMLIQSYNKSTENG